MAVLTELGLTLSQAKVYLTLIQIGSSKVGPISKTTGIHRENLYQVIRSLEGAGLIGKELGPVAKYKAISLDEALSMLIKRKQKQMVELKANAKEILERFKKEKDGQGAAINDPQTEENSKFLIINGKEAILRRIRETLRKTQTSVDIVTTPIRFSYAILDFANDYNKALKRGTKIRIATEKHVAEKTALQTVQNLKRNQLFELKYFPEPTHAIISLFDKKEAFVSLSATAHLNGTSGIWSNNSSFIALAQNYFETKWNNTQEK